MKYEKFVVATKLYNSQDYWLAKLVVINPGDMWSACPRKEKQMTGNTDEVTRFARENGCYQVRHWIHQ